MSDLMSLVPPADLVYGTLQRAVVPAAGAAALALALVLCLGRWAGALGSGVAVLAGIAFANWQMKTPYLPWASEKPGKAWFLPAAAVLVAVGLASRWVGLMLEKYKKQPQTYAASGIGQYRWWWLANLAVWVPRVAAVAWVSGWGIAAETATEEPTLRWLIAAGSLLGWAAFDAVARAGCSKEAVALLSLAAVFAGGLLVYSHSATDMEIATMLGMALFGVAVVGVAAKADVSGAVPALFGFLPGFLAYGRWLTIDNGKTPVESYWLVGLAPLALVPFLVPALARRNGVLLRLLRLLLILAPLVVALYLAHRAAPISFEYL